MALYPPTSYAAVASATLRITISFCARDSGLHGAAHWSLTFAVDDADAVAEKAAELGGTVLVAPFVAPSSG
jgi:predicted enzyme related to lactoylglutathione lyase